METRQASNSRRVAIATALVVGAASIGSVAAQSPLGTGEFAASAAKAAETGIPMSRTPTGAPPTVQSGTAQEVTETAATLVGTVNPHHADTHYYFQYGATPAYGSVSAEFDAGAGGGPVRVAGAVSGLQPYTVYHFRIVATNSLNPTGVMGEDSKLTTKASGSRGGGAAASSIRPPTASTGGARPVSLSTATLNATVNPHGNATSYYFQYGPTDAYGSQTSAVSLGDGTSPERVSQTVFGLQPNTRYHFRVVATSPAVSTPSYGPDSSFITGRIRLRAEFPSNPVAPYGRPFTLTGTLTGTGSAGQPYALDGNPFPFSGTFSQLVAPVVTTSAGGFSFRVPGLTHATLIRLASPTEPSSYSNAVTLQVAAVVTLRAKLTRKPGFELLSGVVEPTESGAPVSVQWLRPGTATPVTLAVARVGRGSHFTAVVAAKRSGHFSAIVRLPNNGAQVSGVSPQIRARVG